MACFAVGETPNALFAADPNWIVDSLLDSAMRFDCGGDRGSAFRLKPLVLLPVDPFDDDLPLSPLPPPAAPPLALRPAYSSSRPLSLSSLSSSLSSESLSRLR